MLGWDYAINPYWMAHSNISIYWRPQLSYISSQQACITLFSDSLCQNELIRSLFLREVGVVQDESCGTNSCFCRESPLKLALKRSLNCFSKLKENGSGSSVFTDPSIATWRQDHFHRSSGVATPGTQLQWKGNSLLSPCAERGLVPSTREKGNYTWPKTSLNRFISSQKAWDENLLTYWQIFLSVKFEVDVLLSGCSSVLAL